MRTVRLYGGPMHGNRLDVVGTRFEVAEKPRHWFVPKHATASTPKHVKIRKGHYQQDPEEPETFLWRGWDGEPLRRDFNAEEFLLIANNEYETAKLRWHERTKK